MKIDIGAVRSALRRVGKGLKEMLLRNWGLKLMSVLFAFILWSYVITSSPSITREKTLTGLYVNVTGQTVLVSRELSILGLSEINDAQARVRVSQSAYSQVTSDNVRIELDLSNVRAAGKQQVRLRGTSAYGTVIGVIPEYVEVNVEQRDQRVVPVNWKISGDTDENYWYTVSRTNPSQITVSGPTSVVQTVSSALIRPDVSGRFEKYSAAEPYTLFDAQGNEVTETLSRSTSSVTVTVDIYPERTLPISSDIEELIAGQVADGYEVVGVEVSPPMVEVAAEQALLNTLTELAIEPVDVTGMAQTFTSLARVQSLRGIQNLSSEEVAVTVTIQEKPTTKRLRNVELEFINEPEGKRLTYSARRVGIVRVTGPASVVNELTRDDVQAIVNLNGLVAGQYEIPIELSVENHPEVTCAASATTVSVTVADVSDAG